MVASQGVRYLLSSGLSGDVQGRRLGISSILGSGGTQGSGGATVVVALLSAQNIYLQVAGLIYQVSGGRDRIFGGASYIFFHHRANLGIKNLQSTVGYFGQWIYGASRWILHEIFVTGER